MNEDDLYSEPDEHTLLEDLRAVAELTRTTQPHLRDVCARAASEIELLTSIVRKIVRGDPKGQEYFDIDGGVIDSWVLDLTDDERAYLHAVQDEVRES